MIKNAKPDIYRPPGGRSEREVAAEVCVRVLESGLVSRTTEVIYRLAVAVGVPVDLIRRTWA